MARPIKQSKIAIKTNKWRIGSLRVREGIVVVFVFGTQLTHSVRTSSVINNDMGELTQKTTVVPLGGKQNKRLLPRGSIPCSCGQVSV